ncbi:MAG: peptide deformylase [Candidatus Bipolaricaulota bacterium]|nr:peptide deformylase [Candidatus Bipolaricaulota bacterium]
MGTSEKTVEVKTYGSPVLRGQAKPVEDIDDDVKGLSQRMVEAMLQANAVGIAAPQLGISTRIIALDINDELHILINPEIIGSSKLAEEEQEGCLSIPGVAAPIPRKVKTAVKGITLAGKQVELEGEGLMARAIQHEIDHLNGVLYIDYLTSTRRKMLLKEYRKQSKEEGEG